MSDGRDFTATVRRGRKVAQPLLVAHVRAGTDSKTRVGLVVSKAVGPAVVRNRVKRRLRHVMRERVVQLPQGTAVVVRALPPAADASSRQLAVQIDAALARSGAVLAR